MTTLIIILIVANFITIFTAIGMMKFVGEATTDMLSIMEQLLHYIEEVAELKEKDELIEFIKKHN